MANIKFSQFTEKTTLGTVDFLVGYTGAENVQISPTNLLSTFVSGSGTAGQVAYFDPSNNLAGENDFFWDYTNNRLGIGTNSPDRKLEVESTGTGEMCITGTTGSRLFFRPTGSYSPGGNFGILVSGAGGPSYLSTMSFTGYGSGVNTIMTLKGDGKVGIGTTSPVAKLQVEGSFISSGISQLGSGGANVYLTSSSAGNVGIGTSAPGYKLDIYGDAVSGIVRVKNVANGRDTFRSENAAGTRTLNFGNDGSGHGLLLIRNSSGTVTNYITGSGDSYFNGGNVGIGTSSPGAKLQITGSTSDTSALAFITRNSSNTSLFSIRNDGRVDVAGATVFATSVQSPFFTTDGGRSFKMDSVAFVGGYSNGSDANAANDLGSTTNQWRDIYISGDITSSAGGATFAGSVALSDSGQLQLGTGNDAQIYNNGAHLFIDNSVGNSYLRNTSTSSIIIRNSTGGDIQLDNEFAGNILFNTSNLERMRITSSGVVGIGTDGPFSFGTGSESGVFIQPDSYMGISIPSSTTSALILRRLEDGSLVRFYNSNATVGNINVSGSSTVYATSSDYRLKEDLQDFAGLDMISKIPIYDFKWKVDESRSYGVIAHELQEVLPQAVTGEKDAEEMQGVDYSKIVPLLVKSIQELKSEIEELKSK